MERRKEEEQKADDIRQAQEKLDSMKKTEFGAKLFEGLTAEMLMNKYQGRLDELVSERVELMKKDKREAQERIRKQERSVSPTLIYVHHLNINIHLVWLQRTSQA